MKQALYELAPDPAVLQKPATDANFATVTAPLWRGTTRCARTSGGRGASSPTTVPRSGSC